MLRNTRLFLVLCLAACSFASFVLADPDVCWTDTGTTSFLRVEPNGNRYTFVISGAPIPGINLPDDAYRFQMLRDFAREYLFTNQAIGGEIKYMLGEDGEDLGYSFDSAFESVPWLTDFVGMLNAFNARQQEPNVRGDVSDPVDIYPFC